MNRLESLDWLRGLLALSIMVYHLTGWELYQPDASELLGRLGIYGVSMFFVVSGLSMAAGYSGFIRSPQTAVRFFIRRIFRIWPLLWVAVAAVTLGRLVLKGQAVDWTLVLLNLTTLFGFISPGAYINTGAWSIGNEMVYYALTPAFVAIFNRRLLYGNVAVAASLLIGLYFGLEALSTKDTLASQWATYIHPLNNLCFYAAGLAIYYNARDLTLKAPTTITMLFTSIAVLAWYPADGDLIHVVTGPGRVAFFLASTLMVVSFYRLTSKPPRWVSRPLAALGVATYGVYLLHPIVYPLVERCARMLGWADAPYLVMTLTVALTIAVARLLYERLEAPLIRWGKRLTPDPKASDQGRTLRSPGNP